MKFETPRQMKKRLYSFTLTLCCGKNTIQVNGLLKPKNIMTKKKRGQNKYDELERIDR